MESPVENNVPELPVVETELQQITTTFDEAQLEAQKQLKADKQMAEWMKFFGGKLSGKEYSKLSDGMKKKYRNLHKGKPELRNTHAHGRPLYDFELEAAEKTKAKKRSKRKAAKASRKANRGAK